ncbi:MAG TPA: hypothetical protein VL129_06410 [Pseudomonas sp.]|uniref:hypothetical protein n=1 Tax=Pseudomonas sp. TaxID=306 RepID=UPI002CEC1EAE|nr:hypothetical protein [Pseudomonas sp.]HTO18762.1 hypothetical protein [Pseudomonas sp.]
MRRIRPQQEDGRTFGGDANPGGPDMLKFLTSAVGIIFLIGLIVVIGILMMIF